MEDQRDYAEEAANRAAIQEENESERVAELAEQAQDEPNN